MKVAFPSEQFDEAVAAVGHGSASDEQMGGLNEILRTNSLARDEFILRVELHSRLASEPDLFVSAAPEGQGAVCGGGLPFPVLPMPNFQPSEDGGIKESA